MLWKTTFLHFLMLLFIYLQVLLTLEPRIFKFHDESIFRYHNGKKFSKYNREFDAFKDRLFEFDISFIPRYDKLIIIAYDYKMYTFFMNQRVGTGKIVCTGSQPTRDVGVCVFILMVNDAIYQAFCKSSHLQCDAPYRGHLTKFFKTYMPIRVGEYD